MNTGPDSVGPVLYNPGSVFDEDLIWKLYEYISAYTNSSYREQYRQS